MWLEEAAQHTRRVLLKAITATGSLFICTRLAITSGYSGLDMILLKLATRTPQ